MDSREWLLSEQLAKVFFPYFLFFKADFLCFYPLLIPQFTPLKGRNSLKIDKQSFIKDHVKHLKPVLKKRFSEGMIIQVAREAGFILRKHQLSKHVSIQ